MDLCFAKPLKNFEFLCLRMPVTATQKNSYYFYRKLNDKNNHS